MFLQVCVCPQGGVGIPACLAGHMTRQQYISRCTVDVSQLVWRQQTGNIKCMMGYVTWYTTPPRTTPPGPPPLPPGSHPPGSHPPGPHPPGTTTTPPRITPPRTTHPPRTTTTPPGSRKSTL